MGNTLFGMAFRSSKIVDSVMTPFCSLGSYCRIEVKRSRQVDEVWTRVETGF